MVTWISSHRYGLTTAIRGLRHEPWQWLSSAVVIATAVLLPWLLFNLVNLLSPGWQQAATDPEISVFMKTDANTDDLVRARSVIDQQLKAAGPVAARASVVLVSKAQALEQLKAQTARAGGDSRALSILQDNPLPDAFVLQLKDMEPAVVNALARELQRAIPKVDLVQVDSAWIQTLSRLISILTLVLWVVVAIFCAVVMAVTFNATRSQALQLRDEIEIARLVGATDAFIRRPFLYRGALLGLLGGVLALLIGLVLWLGVAYVLQPLSAPGSEALQVYATASNRWFESGVVVVATTLLGGLGGVWAAQRQLGLFKALA